MKVGKHFAAAILFLTIAISSNAQLKTEAQTKLNEVIEQENKSSKVNSQ